MVPPVSCAAVLKDSQPPAAVRATLETCATKFSYDWMNGIKLRFWRWKGTNLSNLRVLIAGGGTGVHIIPAQFADNYRLMAHNHSMYNHQRNSALLFPVPSSVVPPSPPFFHSYIFKVLLIII
jgi:hypothetical protein